MWYVTCNEFRESVRGRVGEGRGREKQRMGVEVETEW